MPAILRSPVWPNPRVRPPYGATEIDWSHPLASGLVGCWLFNEMAGGLYDLTRTIGVRMPSGTVWDGANGTLNFNTSSARLPLSPAPHLNNLPQISVVARVLLRSFALSSFPRIICKETTTSEGWRVQVQDTGSLWFVRMTTGAPSGGGVSAQSPDGTVTPGVWATLAATWDGTTLGSGIALYQNGRQLATTPTDGPGSPTDDSPEAPFIGNRGDNARPWEGWMSTVLLYRRVLSSFEVLWLYSEPYAFLRPIVRRRWFVSEAPPPPPPSGSASRRLLVGVGV